MERVLPPLLLIIRETHFFFDKAFSTFNTRNVDNKPLKGLIKPPRRTPKKGFRERIWGLEGLQQHPDGVCFGTDTVIETTNKRYCGTSIFLFFDA